MSFTLILEIDLPCQRWTESKSIVPLEHHDRFIQWNVSLRCFQRKPLFPNAQRYLRMPDTDHRRCRQERSQGFETWDIPIGNKRHRSIFGLFHPVNNVISLIGITQRELQEPPCTLQRHIMSGRVFQQRIAPLNGISIPIEYIVAQFSVRRARGLSRIG